jgi:hypothetical protein
VTILSKTLLSFVRGHFVTFSFFSARHDSNNLNPQPLKGGEDIFLINNYKLIFFQPIFWVRTFFLYFFITPPLQGLGVMRLFIEPQR